MRVYGLTDESSRLKAPGFYIAFPNFCPGKVYEILLRYLVRDKHYSLRAGSRLGFMCEMRDASGEAARARHSCLASRA